MTRRLHALRVGNFKAFADTQHIPIKPITLIFGPNSAGKSSFIHSLALAHEAEFGPDKRNHSRLDIHHTSIGGSAIDLGGFRQYVHRRELRNKVEWGAEVLVSSLEGRLAQLLAPLTSLTVNLTIGMELDPNDRATKNSAPRVESIEFIGDGNELMRMSRRGSDSQLGVLRVDRLNSDSAVFRQVLKAIVESATTSEEMRPEDFDSATKSIDALLVNLRVIVEKFFPVGVEVTAKDSPESNQIGNLFPVSKGNRSGDIADAVRLLFPRTLNEIIKGVSEVFRSELNQLQYLGPLRSFPPRHLAFAENDDSNWFAGGGFAWDEVRNNEEVRDAVNLWLGADMLKTKYQLIVKSLVPTLQVASVLEDQIEKLLSEMEPSPEKYSEDYEFDDEGQADPDDPMDRWSGHDSITVANRILDSIQSTAEHVNELVLIDQNNRTQVSHRDVGIGISQVLPVLVMALGSKDRLIAIEQPEIHLHPALQAELADVFIESATGENPNTFILETHSEHLILRLMRRIREGDLDPNDICVLFVKPANGGSTVTELRLDSDGDFMDDWPGGFFEEAFREKFAGR